MRAEAAVAILVVVGFAAAPPTASAGGLHRGAGIVTAVTGRTVTLREGGASHTMLLTPRSGITIVADDRVSRIASGDYVGEECGLGAKGDIEARRLILYRPAWKELASPES